MRLTWVIHVQYIHTHAHVHMHTCRNCMEYITSQPPSAVILPWRFTCPLWPWCQPTCYLLTPHSLLNTADHVSLSMLRPCPSSAPISLAHISKSKDLCVPDKYLWSDPLWDLSSNPPAPLHPVILRAAKQPWRSSLDVLAEEQELVCQRMDLWVWVRDDV